MYMSYLLIYLFVTLYIQTCFCACDCTVVAFVSRGKCEWHGL